MATLLGKTKSASVEDNKESICKNRAALFSTENGVMKSRSDAYLCRSLLQEIQALLQKNYCAAFLGNRHLANQNTDDIFRNKMTILRNMKVENECQKNFKEASINKV